MKKKHINSGTNNPILQLLYDNKGRIKYQITQDDLEKFEAEHVTPNRNLLLQRNDTQLNNSDPLGHRKNLIHCLDEHANGYLPFGDLALMSDEECNFLHFFPLVQIHRYLSPNTTLNYFRRSNTIKDVSYYKVDSTFLSTALLYDTNSLSKKYQ